SMLFSILPIFIISFSRCVMALLTSSSRPLAATSKSSLSLSRVSLPSGSALKYLMSRSVDDEGISGPRSYSSRRIRSRSAGSGISWVFCERGGGGGGSLREELEDGLEGCLVIQGRGPDGWRLARQALQIYLL